MSETYKGQVEGVTVRLKVSNEGRGEGRKNTLPFPLPFSRGFQFHKLNKIS